MHTYCILGHAYSVTELISVTFKIDNTTIFAGEIPASPAHEPNGETMFTELCRWSTDVPLRGNLSISGTITGGDLFFALIAKAVIIIIPDTTSQEVAPDTTSQEVAPETTSQEVLVELEYPDSQPEQHAVANLKINNIVQSVPVNISKPELPGDIRGWHYCLPDGCSFDFNYAAGPFSNNI